jgi:hypothetical protein
MLTRVLKSSCIGLFALALAVSAPVALAQMPQQPDTTTLSASDVSQEQVQTAARIATTIQSAMRAQQMKMRKQMKQKYGNPQQMDSTQKAQARKEMRRQQMQMRKKQMQMMQAEAEKEGMSPKMFRQIMRSAQQDSTLKKDIQAAMKAQMKKRQSQMNQGPPNQNQ